MRNALKYSTVSVLGLLSTPALAGGLDFSICRVLATSGLVDERSTQIQRAVAEKEWEGFCSESVKSDEAVQQRSGSFNAAFKYAASYEGSLGSSNSSGASSKKIDYEKTCRENKAEYMDYLNSSESIRTGSYLAEQTNECIKTIAQNTRNEAFIWGTTKPIGKDGFEARFNFVPSPTVQAVQFAAVYSNDVSCKTSGGQSPIGQKMYNGLSLNCRFGKSSLPVTGSFVFDSVVGDHKTPGAQKVVDFTVETDAWSDMKKEIGETYEQKYKEMNKRIRSLEGALTKSYTAIRLPAIAIDRDADGSSTTSASCQPDEAIVSTYCVPAETGWHLTPTMSGDGKTSYCNYTSDAGHQENRVYAAAVVCAKPASAN